MGVRTMDEAERPLGVIGCLAAGFEAVGRHLWLIALPLLLDLFLWLGPQLSAAPLVRRFVAFLSVQPGIGLEAAGQTGLLVQVMEQLGERFNVFLLLRAMPILRVPSLMAQQGAGPVSPLGERGVLAVPNLSALAGWMVLLVPIGLGLGFSYLSGVARTVRAAPVARSAAPRAPVAGTAERGESLETREIQTMGKLVRVTLFAACIFAAGVVLLPPWAFLALRAVETSGWGFWLLALGSGFAVSYVGVHFLFVVPAVLVGGRGLLRATWESIVLIRAQLPSVLGLLLLALLLSEGLGHIWLLPADDSWALLVAIVGNSCIATALIAAGFVFYQNRMGRLPA